MEVLLGHSLIAAAE